MNIIDQEENMYDSCKPIILFPEHHSDSKLPRFLLEMSQGGTKPIIGKSCGGGGM